MDEFGDRQPWRKEVRFRFQVSAIANFIADALAAYRFAPPGSPGGAQRDTAAHDVTCGSFALAQATGRAQSEIMLPRPLDRATFGRVASLIGPGARRAEIAWLGDTGLGVVGYVPGAGIIGAYAGSHLVASVLYRDFIRKPIAEVTRWAVTSNPVPAPLPASSVDLTTFVKGLSPHRTSHRAIAAALLGVEGRTDAAIVRRFPRTDFDLPGVISWRTAAQADSRPRRAIPPSRGSSL